MIYTMELCIVKVSDSHYFNDEMTDSAHSHTRIDVSMTPLAYASSAKAGQTHPVQPTITKELWRQGI